MIRGSTTNVTGGIYSATLHHAACIDALMHLAAGLDVNFVTIGVARAGAGVQVHPRAGISNKFIDLVYGLKVVPLHAFCIKYTRLYHFQTT